MHKVKKLIKILKRYYSELLSVRKLQVASKYKFKIENESTSEMNTNDFKFKFFDNDEVINKINFKNVVKRVVHNQKNSLLIDPLYLRDIQWYINSNEKHFKSLLLDKYNPNKQLTLNMPKSNLTYRPVSYLLPVDSVIYQALVDYIIKYKIREFSKNVYSNILNPIKEKKVFHNPVQHWLKMRSNLRKLHKKGFNYYFSSDISGYFENIKIEKLIELIGFFVGKKEYNFIKYLKKLLYNWKYADSQGIIQTHPASSILGKIYLTPVDSALSFLENKYLRYVDEFHIMATSKRELISYVLKLNQELRELGLNLNASKTKILERDQILEDLNEEKDFFASCSYYYSSHKYDLALKVLKDRFDKLKEEYKENKKINIKIFRRCIHAFTSNKVNDGIVFSLKMLKIYPEQTPDIIKYLKVFINSEKYIITFIFKYLEDKDSNLYKWQQIWLLMLLLEVKDKNRIDFDKVWRIANNKNQDELARSIAYIVLTKYLDKADLVILKRHYLTAKSLIIKRTLLFCLSKLPKKYIEDILKIEPNDDINLVITKLYLHQNHVNFDNFTLL